MDRFPSTVRDLSLDPVMAVFSGATGRTSFVSGAVATTCEAVGAEEGGIGTRVPGHQQLAQW